MAKLIWTEDSIRVEALKYSTFVEFNKGAPGAYRKAQRDKSIKRLAPHLVASTCIKYTDTDIHNVALKFKTKKEFELAESSIYSIMHQRKIVAQCCSHMTGLTLWNEESIRAEALKYTTRKDFKANGKGAVGASVQLGIYDEICAHMKAKPKALAPSNLKGIYLLYKDTNIVYVGKSNCCMLSRIRSHKQDKEFNTVEFYEIANQPDIDVIELYLINLYSPIHNKESNSNGILTVTIDNIDNVVTKKSVYEI